MAADLPLTGGCMCGAVRFKLTRAPGWRSTATAPAAGGGPGPPPPSRPASTARALRVVGGRRLSCGGGARDGGYREAVLLGCGSHLFSRNPADRPEHTIRHVAFDDDPGVRPSSSVRRLRRAWEPIPDDGLPRFPESKPRFTDPRDATAATAARNAEVAASLPLSNPGDAELATRGRIAPLSRAGASAPRAGRCGTWRRRVPRRRGAARGQPEPLAPGAAQQRGRPVRGRARRSTRCAASTSSNITFIEGDTGWIVIDPLTSAETARAALALVDEHLGERPVTAVIYTHSHVDHFGGVRGVIDEADVAAGRCASSRPPGFLEAAVSENVVAGNAMTRRGTLHVRRPAAQGPAGPRRRRPGQGRPALGTQGLIAPTEDDHRHRHRAGGRRRAHRVPGHARHRGARGDELPLPGPPRAVHGRELHLHAAQPLHAARAPRSATPSAGASTSRRRSSCSATTPTSASPATTGPAGATTTSLAPPRTPARHLPVPPRPDPAAGQPRPHARPRSPRSCACRPRSSDEPASRGYYGTVNHNAKAVYQRYLGWFDGNPAHLHPHPPVEAGTRYVEFMGGADAVLARAREVASTRATTAGWPRW